MTGAACVEGRKQKNKLESFLLAVKLLHPWCQGEQLSMEAGAVSPGAGLPSPSPCWWGAHPSQGNTGAPHVKREPIRALWLAKSEATSEIVLAP